MAQTEPIPTKVWHATISTIDCLAEGHRLSVACHKSVFRRGVSPPGFRSQFLRAVASIAANIAEGAGQRSQRQFARHLDMAMSSAHEVDNDLELAAAIEIFEPDLTRSFQEQTWEIKRMITGLQRTVLRKAEEEERGMDGPPEHDDSPDRGHDDLPNDRA